MLEAGKMSEQDLLQSAKHALHQLTALRARLANDGTPGSPEIKGAVGDLLLTLEELQDHHVLMHEALARERRQAEHGSEVQHERLRSLVTEIVIAEERSRQSLVAELHNGLGQDIALAKMKLSVLRSSSTAELSQSLTGIEQLIEQAYRSLRSITFQLSPPSLHDLGLVPALHWLAQDTAGRYGLEVRIENEGFPAVADDRMRVILFRAVKELLTNVATHAAAKEVLVSLGSEDGALQIRVEDGGKGFDTADLGLECLGLFGIREQLRYVGGSMNVDSAPGRGTTVSLTVPLVTEAASTT
jgi:two-component system, chemotaxis family, CheB/CheR fusion protein